MAASVAGVAPARNALARRLKDATDPQCFSISKAVPPVSLRSVKRARGERRFCADHFMRLCAHVGIDPESGQDCERFACGPILWWFVGVGIAVRRALLGLTLTQAAKQIGISHATCSRAENGKSVSIESFLAVCEFAGIDPRDCVYCYDGPRKINGDKCIGQVAIRETPLVGAKS